MAPVTWIATTIALVAGIMEILAGMVTDGMTAELYNSKSIQICDMESGYLICDIGYLTIESAIYGRTSNEHCQRGNYEITTDCISDETRTVRTNCGLDDGIFSDCFIQATNSLYDDPCVGVSKYLEVNYTCASITGNPPELADCPTAPVQWNHYQTPSCNDTEDGNITPVCTLPPGSNFGPRTTVRCVCTDSDGATDTCQFFVEDTSNCPPPTGSLCDVSFCLVDSNCPQGQICCPTCSAGRACVEPVSSPTTEKPRTIVVSSPTTEKPRTIVGAIANEELRSSLKNVSAILSSGNATTEVIQEAAAIVEEAVENEEYLAEDPENLEVVIDTLELITDAEDPAVTEPVVRIVNNLMDVDAEVLTGSTNEGGRVVAALEEQIANVQTTDMNFTAVLDNVGVTAVKVNRDVLGRSFAFANVFPEGSRPTIAGDLRENYTRLFADGGEIPGNQTVTEIAVPATVLDSMGADVDVKEVPVSFFIYGNSILFTPSRATFDLTEGENDSNTTFEERIVSQVISVTIKDDVGSRRELPSKGFVVTKFITDEDERMDEEVVEKECVHWSYNDRTGEGFWSTDGCTRLTDDLDRVVCSCRRLASFAVLIRVRKGSFDEVALYYITLIGSAISGVCLCLCLVTFLSFRSYRSKQPTQIHINLCLSLLGFYLAFLLSPLATRDESLCAVASAVTHFFCLATVGWMSAEAVNLYFLFVKMKRGDVRFFLPVACLLAYGLPAFCAILVAIFDTDSNFLNADYCFIHPGPALYFGFLVEVAVLFVVNFAIFIWILKKAIFRPLMVSKTRENARRDEIIKRVRHAILFWFILGLSWLFGVLAVITGSLVFNYLYCICISLQGLVMFLLLCVANPEFRGKFRCGETWLGYTAKSRSGSTINSSSSSRPTTTSQSELTDVAQEESNI